MLRILTYSCAFASVVLASPQTVHAQEPTGDPLARLVAEAVERSPSIAAAGADAEALQAHVSQAGSWDDPVLSLGFANLRTTSFDFSDDLMTMKTVRLAQRIPLPGQIGHAREAAALRAMSAERAVGITRVDVASSLKESYAELYYHDRALDIVAQHLAVLRGLKDVTLTRYATGVGRQPAVLRAGLEIDGLEAQRVQLMASRHSTLARLNALRDRPAATPLDETAFPLSLLALTRRGGETLSFAAALEGTTGSSLVGAGGLPSLDSLIALALEEKPELRAHIARIRAQEQTVALAQAMRWPAPQLSVAYGQRDGFPDMLNASLSFSLPIFLGAKQGAAVREADATLARERAMHVRMVAEIDRDVTIAYSQVLDALGQLGFYDTGILLRSEAAFDATLGAYRSGAEDFLALLESQTRLYRVELERHRRLADLLAAWADLERAVGMEIKP